MSLLIAGLVIFLGMHSIRIFAEPTRQRLIERIGEMPYKGLYTVISLIGFFLIVYGYGEARVTTTPVWNPPMAMRHLAALLTLLAFVLLAASYVPGNRIKRALGHPMILSVKVWAIAHLLANGTVADILLFGAFLLWSVLDFRAARMRDRDAGTKPAAVAGVSMARDVATVLAGVIGWVVFALWLHGWLIGIRPFG